MPSGCSFPGLVFVFCLIYDIVFAVFVPFYFLESLPRPLAFFFLSGVALVLLGCGYALGKAAKKEEALEKK